VYCDHCQTTVVDDATLCPSCRGPLTDRPEADGVDLSQAPTVVLKVGPCESCGASSLPGSTLCLPCTRAFESILNTQPTAPMPAQAPALPSAPGGSASQDAATVMMAAVPAAPDEPLAEDEEYVDDDEPAAPTFSAADPADWSTPSASSGEHQAIVAVPPWARKGPDADEEAAAPPSSEPPAAEPTPWWERSGLPAPTATTTAATATATATPEVARYVPPPGVAPPVSQSLESTLARQAMRPKTPPVLAAVPVVTRPAPSSSRSRTMVVVAICAGVAAIGTPVMWKLAFASRPTTVSALQMEPVGFAAEPTAPRAERVHGGSAAAAPATRVYQDLQPIAAEAAPTPAPVVAPPPAHAPARPARKPAVTAPAPEPIVAAPVAAPEPPPLLVATPPPVVSAPTTAAAPPASVHTEAVPLGQIYEVSQVETRPSVVNRFEPVLPARISTSVTVVVIVRVLVSPSGRAVEASPVKNPTNDAGVGAAAAATVRQWGFAPARKKGQPVSCWLNVGVVFKSAS
jgi:TonB family protein